MRVERFVVHTVVCVVYFDYVSIHSSLQSAQVVRLLSSAHESVHRRSVLIAFLHGIGAGRIDGCLVEALLVTFAVDLSLMLIFDLNLRHLDKRLLLMSQIG